MENNPAEVFAAWIEKLPEAAGAILCERMALMIPESMRGNLDAFDVARKLPELIRAVGSSAMGAIGVVVIGAALVDYIFSAPSLSRKYESLLDTEESRQRSLFIGQQQEIARKQWAELRGGPLSTAAIDHWNDVQLGFAQP